MHLCADFHAGPSKEYRLIFFLLFHKTHTHTHTHTHGAELRVGPFRVGLSNKEKLDWHSNFCLKVVTHPSTNPARSGLTSELVVSCRSSRLESPKKQYSLKLCGLCSVAAFLVTVFRLCSALIEVSFPSLRFLLSLRELLRISYF